MKDYIQQRTIGVLNLRKNQREVKRMDCHEYHGRVMDKVFYVLDGGKQVEPSLHDWEYERRQQRELAEEQFLEHALDVLQEQRDALNAILSKMPEPKKLFPMLWNWQKEMENAVARLEDKYTEQFKGGL